MGLAAGAAIGAVGALGSAAIGSSATSKAADAQTQAAQMAQQTQLQMYNQTRSDLQPYMNYGNNAFSQLANIFGFGGQAGGGGTFGPNSQLATQALTQMPGYQFGLDQGVQALDRSAASRGTALSGGQLRDSQIFGQNYAMQNAWQPYISQLNSAAGIGENAAAGVGNIGASTGAGVAQSQLAAGQSQAAGIVGGANQWTSGIQGVTNALSPLFTSSYGGQGGASINGINGAQFGSQLPGIISGYGGGTFDLNGQQVTY